MDVKWNILMFFHSSRSECFARNEFWLINLWMQKYEEMEFYEAMSFMTKIRKHCSWKEALNSRLSSFFARQFCANTPKSFVFSHISQTSPWTKTKRKILSKDSKDSFNTFRKHVNVFTSKNGFPINTLIW